VEKKGREAILMEVKPMKIEDTLAAICGFVEEFGRDSEVDINNAVFIAKTLLRFDVPLDFRDGGRLGIESLRLYSLFDEISDLKNGKRKDREAAKIGKKLSAFSSEELRLMASYLWNEGKSSLFLEERKRAANLIKTHFGEKEVEMETPVPVDSLTATASG
jgi:hypothetical protein